MLLFSIQLHNFLIEKSYQKVCVVQFEDYKMVFYLPCERENCPPRAAAGLALDWDLTFSMFPVG